MFVGWFIRSLTFLDSPRVFDTIESYRCKMLSYFSEYNWVIEKVFYKKEEFFFHYWERYIKTILKRAHDSCAKFE